MTRLTTAKSEINAALNAANGRRRERTIGYDSIIQVLRETIHDGWGYTGGGTVANAYRYPACQTVALAGRHGQRVILAIAVQNAKKGSASRPSWLQSSIPSLHSPSTARNVREWVRGGGTGHDGEIVMSIKTARALVAEHLIRRRARRLIDQSAVESFADTVMVSAEDSLDAGNCRVWTEKVASWFPGRTEVNGQELINVVREREPSLVWHAERAVRTAARRAVSV